MRPASSSRLVSLVVPTLKEDKIGVA